MATPIVGKNGLLTWPRVVMTGIVMLLVLGAAHAFTICYAATESVAEALEKYEDKSDEKFMQAIQALHSHELAFGHVGMSERVSDLIRGQEVQQRQLDDIRNLLVKDRSP